MRSHSDQNRKDKSSSAANREKNLSETVQKKEKQSGLPKNLKTGFENLSRHTTNESLSSETVQRKVNTNSSEHLTKHLGSGTFGTAYETSKDHVAKVTKTQTKKKIAVSSSLEGLELDPEAAKEDTQKKAPNDSALVSEYNMMKEISQKPGESFISKPVYLGVISIEKGKSPADFDEELVDGQKAIVMEKVNVLDIHQDVHERKEHEPVHTNVIIKEINIFHDLMELRWKFIEKDYLHDDIKHNNAGYGKNSKLKAIDLGKTKELKPDYHTTTDEGILKMTSNQHIIPQGQGTSDVIFSFSIMLLNILSQLGIKKEELYSGRVPKELQGVVIGLLKREVNPKFDEMSQYINSELKAETIDYIKKVVTLKINPKIWRPPQEKSTSELLAPPAQVPKIKRPEKTPISQILKEKLNEKVNPEPETEKINVTQKGNPFVKK